MFQVKAIRQEASILQMKSKGSLPEISLLLGGGSIFLFYSVLQGIGYGRAICFTQSTHPDANLILKHLRDTPRKCLTRYLGTMWPHPVDT